jgi:hypothetical protein
MKTIIATSVITLDPVRVKPAEPPDTYLGAARALLAGVRALAGASPPTPTPMALLAYTLENTLKAYLCRSGGTQGLEREEQIIKDATLRHNLLNLWSTAVAENLKVSRVPPGWVETLSDVHDAPYYLRYSTKIHAIVLPAMEPMTTELADLIDTVQRQLHG